MRVSKIKHKLLTWLLYRLIQADLRQQNGTTLKEMRPFLKSLHGSAGWKAYKNQRIQKSLEYISIPRTEEERLMALGEIRSMRLMEGHMLEVLDKERRVEKKNKVGASP